MTSVWTNHRNGHHFSEGPEGMYLNGFPATERPIWATGAPDAVFGPLVPWHGGECPVDANMVVRCIFRGRRPYIGPAIWPDYPKGKEAAMWAHAPFPGRPNPDGDIVAYQVRVEA
jgi:hypothetical protein